MKFFCDEKRIKYLAMKKKKFDKPYVMIFSNDETKLWMSKCCN